MATPRRFELCWGVARFVRLLCRVRVIACAAGLVAGGLNASGHGSFHERLAELQAALTADPTDAGRHFALGSLYCEHGDWQPALAAMTRVDALAPDQYRTDLVRGVAWRTAGELKESCLALDRLLVKFPQDGLALLERARTWDALRDGAASVADYRGAWRALPEAKVDVVDEITAALMRYGHADEAAVLLESSMDRMGAFPFLRTRALELALATGRFDDALRHVEALRAQAPQPEPWMAERATVLARAGRGAEALAAWDALLSHLHALPTLARGTPARRQLAEHARRERAALATAASRIDSVVTSTLKP